jgi:hypothetical protein
MADYELTAFDPASSDLKAPPLATDRYVASRDFHVIGDITVTGTVDGRDITVDGTKLDLLTVLGPVDLDQLQLDVANIEIKTDNITITGPIDLDANQAKLDLLTVTGAIDLDQLLLDVGEKADAVELVGDWNPASGVPTATRKGQLYRITAAGIIVGYNLEADDYFLALVDNPSMASADWLPIYNHPGRVDSVAGRDGAVVLVEADITDLQPYLLQTDIDTRVKLETIIGENLLTTDVIDTLAELNTIVTDATLDDVSGTRDPNPHTHQISDILDIPVNVSYTFAGRDIAAGDHYVGGFYEYSSNEAALTKGSSVLFNLTGNSSDAGYFFIVWGSGGTDGTNITLTVTGDSIDDLGNLTAADSEVLYSGPPGALTLNQKLETTKRWPGSVTCTLTCDGTASTANFNYAKVMYEHVHDSVNITWKRFFMTGLCDNNDANFDVEVMLHKETGWTYASSGWEPTTGSLFTMQGDYGATAGIKAGKNFAYDRVFDTPQTITPSEGVVVKVVTSVAKAVAYAQIRLGGTGNFTP